MRVATYACLGNMDLKDANDQTPLMLSEVNESENVTQLLQEQAVSKELAFLIAINLALENDCLHLAVFLWGEFIEFKSDHMSKR